MGTYVVLQACPLMPHPMQKNIAVVFIPLLQLRLPIKQFGDPEGHSELVFVDRQSSQDFWLLQVLQLRE